MNLSDKTRSIEKALADAGSRLQKRNRVRALLHLIAGAVLGGFVLFLLDYVVRVPFVVRWLMMVGGVVVGWKLWYKRFGKEWKQTFSPTQTAVLYEKEHAGMFSRLISALQFAHVESFPPGVSSNLVEGVVKSATNEYKSSNFSDIVDWSWFKKLLPFLGGGAALWLLLLILSPLATSMFFLRLVNPYAEYPKDTYITAVEMPEMIVGGEEFTLRLKAKGIYPESGSVRLMVGSVESTLEALPLKDKPDTYELQMPALSSEATVDIFLGDDQRIAQKIIPEMRPRLKDVILKVTPPKHTGIKPFELQGATARIQQDSNVTLVVEPNKELETIQLDGTVAGNPKFKQDAGKYSASFTVNKPVRFKVTLKDKKGLTDKDAPEYSISLTPDRAAQIKLDKPQGTADSAPTSRLPLVFTVSDDYGLDYVAIKYSVSAMDEAGQAGKVMTWKTIPMNGKKRLTFSDYWENAKIGALPGKLITLWVEARDNNPNGTVIRSSQALIRVLTAEEYRNLLLQRMGERMESSGYIVDQLKLSTEELEKIERKFNK